MTNTYIGKPFVHAYYTDPTKSLHSASLAYLDLLEAAAEDYLPGARRTLRGLELFPGENHRAHMLSVPEIQYLSIPLWGRATNHVANSVPLRTLFPENILRNYAGVHVPKKIRMEDMPCVIAPTMYANIFPRIAADHYDTNRTVRLLVLDDRTASAPAGQRGERLYAHPDHLEEPTRLTDHISYHAHKPGERRWIDANRGSRRNDTSLHRLKSDITYTHGNDHTPYSADLGTVLGMWFDAARFELLSPLFLATFYASRNAVNGTRAHPEDFGPKLIADTHPLRHLNWPVYDFTHLNARRYVDANTGFIAHRNPHMQREWEAPTRQLASTSAPEELCGVAIMFDRTEGAIKMTRRTPNMVMRGAQWQVLTLIKGQVHER